MTPARCRSTSPACPAYRSHAVCPMVCRWGCRSLVAPSTRRPSCALPMPTSVQPASPPSVRRPPATDGEMTPEEHAARVIDWWASRDERLRDPDGWLTLVGLHWLSQGENRFG